MDDILEIQYEKLGEFQKEIAISASEPGKFELRQRLKREILPEIRKYEAEYAELLAQEPTTLSEQEASRYLVEVTKALEPIELLPPTELPAQLIPLLTELREKLDAPSKTATAKLKVALPIIPLIASYELELDTESLMSNVWRGLKSLFRRRT